MFDLTSSKLLILGLVALIVVGPKDLPVLLRTLGKYVGILRRHANEFRAQFDDAMRDTELATLKAELDAAKRDLAATVSDARAGLETHLNAATQDVEHSILPPSVTSTAAHDEAAQPPDPATAPTGTATPASLPAGLAEASEPAYHTDLPLDAPAAHTPAAERGSHADAHAALPLKTGA